MFASLFKRRKTYFRVKRVGEDGERLTRELKRMWIRVANEKRVYFKIFCIFGELSSADVIDRGLDAEYCDHIEIIFGPKILDKAKKAELRAILEKNDARGSNKKDIVLLSLSTRPTDHVVWIDDKFLYEDIHELNERAEWSTAVPYGQQEDIDAYNSYREELLPMVWKTIRTAGDLDEIGTYDEPVTA